MGAFCDRDWWGFGRVPITDTLRDCAYYPRIAIFIWDGFAMDSGWDFAGRHVHNITGIALELD
jgi:hypothetical protein